MVKFLWILVGVCAIIIIGLIISRRSLLDENESLQRQNKREKEDFAKSVQNLIDEINRGCISTKRDENNLGGLRKVLLNDREAYKVKLNSLQRVIGEQKRNNENKIDELNRKYAKLMRAYLIARRKKEIDFSDEIESQIGEDYLKLGNTPVVANGYVAGLMSDYYLYETKDVELKLKLLGQHFRSDKIADVRKHTADRIQEILLQRYTAELLLNTVLNSYTGIDIEETCREAGLSTDVRFLKEEEIEELKGEIVYLKEGPFLGADRMKAVEEKLEYFLNYQSQGYLMLHDTIADYKKEFESNLTAIPYMSKIVADIMTIDLKKMERSLSWGNNQERKKKVASITELRNEAKDRIEELKWAEYQLAYLLELYPPLQDVIETEFKDLSVPVEDITNYDPVRKFISHEEWSQMSETDRNQLALDRYIESRQKSNWQIGRDYELYCGYCYEKKGDKVEYFGSYNGLEDLGRDLIVTHGKKTLIVQCKYWSSSKEIHENHVMQLYGSVVEYNLENDAKAKGVLITNITLSEKAKKFAEILGISYIEKKPMKEFPRIKCNIGRDENGLPTRIYHLPMDLNYDKTKICNPGEMVVLTVREAEKAGFRRAYKWHGQD